VYAHRRLWLLPQIALFGVCVYYTIMHLQFSTNRNDLVGSDKPYHKNFSNLKRNFRGRMTSPPSLKAKTRKKTANSSNVWAPSSTKKPIFSKKFFTKAI
jgi:hypothetical protein